MADADILSVQLYTLRALGDVERVLDAAVGAGTRYVELLGAHLDDADAVRKKLDMRRLNASSSHVGLDRLRARPEAVMAAASALGITDLFMPAVPFEDREMDAAGWRALGLELGFLAEKLQKVGLRLGYHNHHWELVSKEGDKTALDLIFEAAGSSPLAWQADIAWLVRGGVDPEDWLDRYGDRLLSAHVKDIAKPGEGLEEDGWADVGHGILDWETLLPLCSAHGTRWLVVEHDRPADPAGSIKRSYDFLTKMR